MTHTRCAVGIAVAFGLGCIGTASVAADYTTIRLEREVAASADAVWEKVGGFCAIQEWAKLNCKLTAGKGGLGSVRDIANGRATEIMVAQTPHSYTYAFPHPNPTSYHGTLAVEPIGAGRSKIVYTLLYDQEPLGTAEAKAENRQNRTKTFTAFVENMKALAEAK